MDLFFTATTPDCRNPSEAQWNDGKMQTLITNTGGRRGLALRQTLRSWTANLLRKVAKFLSLNQIIYCLHKRGESLVWSYTHVKTAMIRRSLAKLLHLKISLKSDPDIFYLGKLRGLRYGSANRRRSICHTSCNELSFFRRQSVSKGRYRPENDFANFSEFLSHKECRTFPSKIFCADSFLRGLIGKEMPLRFL